MSLPPVMFLHLLRFKYDAISKQALKIKQPFKFDLHIDLNEFVRDKDTTSWTYTLFAVLSHCGNGSYGHYVNYINRSLTGTWLKFNDDKISLVQQSDAIDANFGNIDNVDDFNAYMLVYVRDNQATDVFASVDTTS